MKKVIDQTLRDLKRGVNKKVLKVPGIEQKVLDATSNEAWGPHGTLLADIADALRNYHEYQMIMGIIWKRMNDTGKNWRHVYKALMVLEYLVAYGSERVIDEIKEHAYQISTLSGFHYIDSNGRDQGNNVRKKSQTLVDLVNDKERIVEVRKKADANRDKFRSTSAGGMYRRGSYGDRYDGGRYEGRRGSRDEDRNGYGRDGEYRYRDDDRYGWYGEVNRYGRDYENRYDRDGYRDDEYWGRSRSSDGHSSRSRSVDRDRDRGFDDDGQSSSCGGGARAEEPQNGRGLERKYSRQSSGTPSSYEDAVGESQSPAHIGRNGESTGTPALESSPPPAPRSASAASNNTSKAVASLGQSVSRAGQEVEVVDEFDPRGPISAGQSIAAAPTISPVLTISNPLAIVPVTSATSTSEANYQANSSGSVFAPTQSAPDVVNQSFEDPFGDSPFKAVLSTDSNLDPQWYSASAVHFQRTESLNAELPQSTAVPKANIGNSFDFGDTFSASSYSAHSPYPPSSNSQFSLHEISPSNHETDILAGIVPPSGPSSVIAPQPGFSAPMFQQEEPGATVYGGFNTNTVSMMPAASNMHPQAPQLSSGTFYSQAGSPSPFTSTVLAQTQGGPSSHFDNGNLLPHAASVVPQDVTHSTTGAGLTPQLNNGQYLPRQNSGSPVASQAAFQNPSGPGPQQNNDVLGGIYSQGPSNPVTTQAGPPSTAGPLALVSQPPKDKFETKSTVWADTLSRGLVNLNISGPKTNPLADIGVDFDAINRKEKRMEKQTVPAVASTVTMGKAMGSGSGIGGAGASALRAPPNPMMGSGMGMMGMGMGMGVGLSSGMNMGGYGGMNQPIGMGLGTNMGMGQGVQMPPQAGLAPRSTMHGGYSPLMSMGGYIPQQPYGGSYQ